MRLLLTTNARLYKTDDGKYWTNLVYGYDFFLRYLSVFDEIRLVAHTEKCETKKTENMLRVDGENLNVYEVPFPHGKLQYIKMYRLISHFVKYCAEGCDAAILRIPDQLAFQVYPVLKKNKIPVAVEVTSDSWDFFAPGSVKSILRPLLRFLWYINQRRICANADGTSYVTEFALQRRYPPKRALKKDGFTTFYTCSNLSDTYFGSPKIYSASDKKVYTIIHVSSSIGGHAKGHSELITALGRLHQNGLTANLVLVGGGTLNLEVESLIDKYNYRQNVRFTGLIPSTSMLSDELKKADLFVFPSYREGLPRVVLEAMAAGLPCIATELPGIKELLDDDCLVPVKDINMLESKIKHFLDNPEKLTEKSFRNFKKALEYKSNLIQEKRVEFYRLLKERAVEAKDI
jgi:glycosyltransferase involved in cell wall biosynthesis